MEFPEDCNKLTAAHSKNTCETVHLLHLYTWHYWLKPASCLHISQEEWRWLWDRPSFLWFKDQCNTSLIFLALTFLRKCTFFSPCPLYVLQSSSSGGHEGNRHKRCNKTHFTACGWVKPYPAVPSCLCSCALLGGAKQLQWCGETDQRTSNSQLFTTDKAAAWTPGQVLGKNWFNLTGAPELPRLRRRPLRPLKKENKADRSHLRHSLSHASEGSCTRQPFTGSLVQTLSKRWPLPGICFREPHGQRLRKAFRKKHRKEELMESLAQL